MGTSLSCNRERGLSGPDDFGSAKISPLLISFKNHLP